MKKFCWLAFFLILTAACLDEPDCYQLNNNYIGITFRVLGTGQGDSVLIRKFGAEEMNKKLPSLSFPLNYFNELDEISIDALDQREGVFKTRLLKYAYKVRNEFISEECGSSFNLSDLRIVEHDFDSARVLNSTPSKGGGTHIEIYRCPVTDTLAITFSELFATTNGATVSNPRARYISKVFDSVTFQYDDVIYPGRAATLKLPVDLTKSETAYVFFSNGQRDTLVLSYDLKTETRYRVCGEQTFASNLIRKKYTFDSLAYAVNSSDETIRNVQDPYRENFKVYQCPPTNRMTIAFRNTGNVAREVTIKSLTGPHLSVEEEITGPIKLSAVVVPVDKDKTESTFRITYDDDTVDEFTVTYVKSTLKFFETCSEPIITGLTLSSNNSNIQILPANSVLQYPSQTNVQIFPR